MLPQKRQRMEVNVEVHKALNINNLLTSQPSVVVFIILVTLRRGFVGVLFLLLLLLLIFKFS